MSSNMIRNRRRKKGAPVRAKKVSFDGYNFASGLEKYMYSALKKAKLEFGYEEEKYTLVEGFHFSNECFERQANGKKDLRDRGGKKILPITYTPDFQAKDRSYIIECKGRANESFPMRWKLFKRLIATMYPNTVLYKPQNQKECDMVIKLIKDRL